MRLRILKQSDSARLTICFTGWAMDGEELKPLSFGGDDVAVVYDYHNLTLPKLPLQYRSFRLLAWSFGVYVAASCAQHLPSFSCAIAVNGTTTPIDNNFGIPPHLINTTFRNLNQANLEKFYRRTVGNASNMARFTDYRPHRSIADAQQELAHYKELCTATVSGALFHHAVISRNDAIFPVHAQKAAWQRDNVPITIIDSFHYPFFDITNFDRLCTRG